MKELSMSIQKNDTACLVITGVTAEGNGVGRITDDNGQQGMAVFVPMSVPGDKVRVKIVKMQKTFAYGIIEEIFVKSPERIKPDCAIFSKCGGCAYRQMTYNEELRIKEDLVRETFRRIGKIDVAIDPITGSDTVSRYRNKAQYPVAEQNGKPVCGFYSRRSHRVQAGTGCALQPEIFQQIVNKCLEYFAEHSVSPYNEEKNTGLMRHIYIRQGESTQDIMLCFVVKDWCVSKLKPLCEELSSLWPEIKSFVMNKNTAVTNVILGKKNKTILGQDFICDKLCGIDVQLSPHSFYQVHKKQAEAMYMLAAEWAELDKEQILLDLYCGIGSIGLTMAHKVKEVIGIEIVPEAVKDAINNAKRNNISNARFICTDAEKAAVELEKEGIHPDVIIVDPPRKGITETTLEAICNMNPKSIIMISCNPATAARDIAILAQSNYIVKKIKPFDLFPRTTHIEVVILMTYCGDKKK